MSTERLASLDRTGVGSSSSSRGEETTKKEPPCKEATGDNAPPQTSPSSSSPRRSPPMAMVDEGEILLADMIDELKCIKSDLSRAHELQSSQLSAQEELKTELVKIKKLVEAGVSICKAASGPLKERERDRDKERNEKEKISLVALQTVQINQWAILNSDINSFKYYESTKEVLRAFKYNPTLYSKSSASLVKSIILTFNQSRGYYISGYIDDGTVFKKYGRSSGDLSDTQVANDTKFFEEVDVTFMRVKFHDAIKNQIYELTGREPIISNEVDADSKNWCIFQGPTPAKVED